MMNSTWQANVSLQVDNVIFALDNDSILSFYAAPQLLSVVPTQFFNGIMSLVQTLNLTVQNYGYLPNMLNCYF